MTSNGLGMIIWLQVNVEMWLGNVNNHVVPCLPTTGSHGGGFPWGSTLQMATMATICTIA